MKIEAEPHDNRTLTLTVEVEDERVQPALRAAARKISKDYRIPGFRPGKAPYEVVLRHYGENALYQAALEDLSQKVYVDALEQEHLEPFAPGEMDVVELKPMKLKFVVPLAPEVELGDHRALRVEFTPPAMADDAVEKEVEHLREHQAVLEPVERPAEIGDVATLDVKAFLHEGENPSDFLITDTDSAVLLDEKAEWPMPGFAAQVVGMRAGDDRKFDLTFPADYVNESLRGQLAHLEVKAKEIKLRTLPAVDDEFAKSLGDYENLGDLRAKLRAEVEKKAAAGVEDAFADKVVSKLVEQAKVSFPPVMLQGELDDYMKDLDRRLRDKKLTLEDFLKIEGKTEEEYREEMKPQAETRLKRSLVLGKIVSSEHLTVDADEVEARIESLSIPWGERAEDMRKVLSSARSRELLTLELLTDKAVDRLKSIARGDELPALARDESESAPIPENLSLIADSRVEAGPGERETGGGQELQADASAANSAGPTNPADEESN